MYLKSERKLIGKENMNIKNVLTLILLLVSIFCLTACGNNQVNIEESIIESTDSLTVDTSVSETETETETESETETLTEFKYKAYGLANVADVGYAPVYLESVGYYDVMGASACCPKCNETIMINPRIGKSKYGMETIMWEDEVSCMNAKNHDDGTPYGFNVIIQYVRVEEGMDS